MHSEVIIFMEKIEKKFGDFIKKLRKENNLTVRQLGEKTGISIAYLSQIENGKRGLPSPEILKKLHMPLGVTYDVLMEKAGYITPELKSNLVPETLKTIQNFEGINELVSNAADIFINSVTDENGLMKETFKNYFLEELNNYPEICEDDLIKYFNDPQMLLHFFNYLETNEKIELLNMIIKDFTNRNINPNEIFKSKIDQSSHIPVLKVPVIGCIAAGQPIFAEDHIEEWTEIPNTWNLKNGEVFILTVKGDSMINSRIYEGDKVLVKIQPEVENGEIAVVNVNGDEATLKRVKKTENGQVILYPDNPRYEPIFINNEKARVIGKVIQVMFEPK